MENFLYKTFLLTIIILQIELQSESYFENASRISRSTIQSYSTKNCIMIDFVIITVIEKENNTSYKLTSLIADNNVSPNPYCIKENEKMEQFTINYFMDVQRINFWQSEFNDTNPVDAPLITGEFYERYFDDDMDLTNFARLIIPGERERITKNHIKNNILNISDTIFKELCVERRNFIIDFLSKRNETDKFLRNYLKMKNIINLSYNKKEHQHQYVYEMKFCRKVNVIEKIINNGYEGNICYTRVPVVTEDKKIRNSHFPTELIYTLVLLLAQNISQVLFLIKTKNERENLMNKQVKSENLVIIRVERIGQMIALFMQTFDYETDALPTAPTRLGGDTLDWPPICLKFESAMGKWSQFWQYIYSKKEALFQ
uniref:Uncharacterized protein n=1 Tax=Strongyloides venezuelensis TaxID=75913 RepID=A0A0K0FRN2_STRVS